MLLRLFRTALNDPNKVAENERHTLDHVPVSPEIDGHTQKLFEAARKYGKPFKCASELLQREVLAVPPDCYVVRAGQRK